MSVRCFAHIFSLLCVTAVGANTCGRTDDGTACHNSQIESSEESEGAALKVEMLQRQKNQALASTRTTVVAASTSKATEGSVEEEDSEVATPSSLASTLETTARNEKRKGEQVMANDEGNSERGMSNTVSENEESNVASLVTKDHNNKMCMLCNKPLAERVNREYKEFRADCGGLSSSSGPNASIIAAPISKLHQVGEDGLVRNGFCQLNFAKSCVDAVANKDYLYWAKSINLISGSPDNAAWDGRYCRLNGFLETSMVALQHDFQATQTRAADLCKTKYAKYNLENITFKDMMSAARYDDKKAPTLHEAELLAAWNCAMGDLGCDLALCAYSFCEKGSGTGLYNECEGWHPVHGMPAPKRM